MGMWRYRRDFKNVWQAKDFKSNVFVGAAKKGIGRRVFSMCGKYQER
jgi:hypothetical protein